MSRRSHKNRWYYFLLLISLSLFFSFLLKELLNTNELFIQSIGDQFTVEQINKIVDFQDKWEWFGYVLIPILLLIKISTITLFLDIGCFFFGKDIKYKTLFKIVVKAEFVFLLVIIFKTAWFYFVQTDYSLEDLQYFYPLSLLQLFGYEGLEPWFIYPLQVVNLFELCYWLLLGYGLSKALKRSVDYAMGIVASSYGVGLLIWVGAVMFFTLNMS